MQGELVDQRNSVELKEEEEEEEVVVMNAFFCLHMPITHMRCHSLR